MLKVVGASWHKTRIGTYILVGAGLLVIVAFVLTTMERPQYDGTYCATAYWAENSGFQIEYWKQRRDLDNIPKGVARICYKDSIYENGWAQLELETQRTYPDWVQAFAAGMLEGGLTWSNIYHQWTNTIASACERDAASQTFCTWLRDTLSSNYENMKKTATERASRDHYWHQISLFFFQLEGLKAGWVRGATRARSGVEEDIPFVDFLIMNAAADIQDLKIYFENFVMREGDGEGANEPQTEKKFFLPSATMLVKIFYSESVQSAWKVLLGHTSAGSYSSMLRIQKRYKFRYHFTPDQKSNTVPGSDIRFTGYPGILGSTDDFYIVKGRQVRAVVAGAAIKNENLDLWKMTDLANAMPLSARVMAANRLAQSRRTWAKAMSRHPTTGCKQWILIDLNKIDALEVQHSDVTQIGSNEVAGRESAIWIVEQLPGRLHAEDMTESFLTGNSTWVANGVPYFEEMLDASGVSRDNFSMDIPEDRNLTTVDAVDKYLRAHAFRGDLLGDESIPYGNIDIKLFSYDSALEMSDFHAFSGPLFIQQRFTETNEEAQTPSIPSESLFVENHPDMAELEVISDRRPVRDDIRAMAARRLNGPFKWSAVTDRIPGIEHSGHPDEWNFDRVSPKWAWHD